MELLENLSQITNPDLDLKSITILGIRFGDSTGSIPSELITEGPNNGWLQTNKGITIRISEKEPSKIIEFILKPELLGDLKITKKKRIEKRFGKTVAIEHQNGFTYYFYEHQKLIIGWNNSIDTLSGIYIGENVIKQTELRIKDFLDKFYEFKAMVPNHNEWNAKSLKYNKPRFYLLKELESLMRAFEIGNDLLHDFQNRKFLEKRSIEDFRPIIDDIEKYATRTKFEKERRESEVENWTDVNQFEMLIQSFMRFSEEMRSILSFNSGWLSASSVVSRYSIYKTQKILDHFDLRELDEIESLLCNLLDPNDTVFTKSELVKNFGFPDVDLPSINMDNY